MTYPTGTPVEELVLDDLLTTLRTIAAPDYHFTLSSASVDRFNPLDTTRVYEFPCILLGTPVVTWSDKISPLLAGELRLVLRGAVEDLETHQTSLSWLAADIRKALLADVTRGGSAVDTKILQQEPHMLVAEAGNPVACVDITVQVRFRHAWDDPNSAQ